MIIFETSDYNATQCKKYIDIVDYIDDLYDSEGEFSGTILDCEYEYCSSVEHILKRWKSTWILEIKRNDDYIVINEESRWRSDDYKMTVETSSQEFHDSIMTLVEFLY